MATARRVRATHHRAALLAGTAAGFVAAVVYATGVIDQSVETPAGGPITLGAVAAFSVIPNIVGAAVFCSLRNTTSPLPLWRIVVIGVTIASFVTPFGLRDAPTGMLAALLVVHVVAGLAALLITPAVATAQLSVHGWATGEVTTPAVSFGRRACYGHPPWSVSPPRP